MLQHQHGLHKVLAPPVKLVDFDWAHAPLRSLTPEGAAGESAPRPLKIHTAGTLTALVVYIALDLDGDPANVVCTGPDSPNVAWDQCARHLPLPLHVRPGDELAVSARHTDCYLQTLRLSNYSADMLVRQEGGAGGAGEEATLVGLPQLVGNPRFAGLGVAMERPSAATR